MSEIINKDGVDIEVFTQEEIEAKQQEALEQFKADNPDKSAELAELQEKLRIADEELAKKGNGDRNFANLRTAKEKAEKELGDFSKKVPEMMENLKREVVEGVNKDYYVDNLKNLAGEDTELLKKIEHEYNTTLKGVIPSSKAEISKKLQDAYLLAARPSEPDALNSSVVSSGGVGRLNIKSQSQKLSPEEQAAGAHFGITSDDLKKYSK